MTATLLRIPRNVVTEDEEPFVLLHVSSMGSGALDLKLIGTDNSTVFTVSFKTSRPASLGTKNSSVNQEDWELILRFILLGTAVTPEHDKVTKDVEAVAKVRNESLEITLQRNVQGITQRLGTISLAEDDDTAVDLFGWCGLAITSKDATKTELQSRNEALREKDEELRRLNDSLAELVKMKAEEENSLLEKFSLLLNEKKLKIRDQQRLLAGANVDPARLEAVEEERAVRGHSVGPSRKGKRKATPPQEEKDDGSDGFEAMDVDEVPNDSEEERPQTPEAGESTADEAESEENAPPVAPPTRKSAKRKSNESTGRASTATASREPSPVPPKRELPFGKKALPPKPAPVVDGSETESDDEL